MAQTPILIGPQGYGRLDTALAWYGALLGAVATTKISIPFGQVDMANPDYMTDHFNGCLIVSLLLALCGALRPS